MTATIRRVLALAAAGALAGCGGAPSDGSGAPVKLTDCKAQDGHVVFHGTLTGTRDKARDYTVQVEVLSEPYGEYVEDAYAFPRDVPAGTQPVPIEGVGSTYVTTGSTFTCTVLAVRPLGQRASISS